MQLARVLNILKEACASNSHLNEIASEAWEFMCQHRPWEADGLSLDTIKKQLDWAILKPIVNEGIQLQKRRLVNAITEEWSSPPADILGEHWPVEPSRNLLQYTLQLSKLCGHVDAKAKILEEVATRQGKKIAGCNRRVRQVQPSDIQRVTEHIAQGSTSTGRKRKHTTGLETGCCPVFDTQVGKTEHNTIRLDKERASTILQYAIDYDDVTGPHSNPNPV